MTSVLLRPIRIVALGCLALVAACKTKQPIDDWSQVQLAETVSHTIRGTKFTVRIPADWKLDNDRIKTNDELMWRPDDIAGPTLTVSVVRGLPERVEDFQPFPGHKVTKREATPDGFLATMRNDQYGLVSVSRLVRHGRDGIRCDADQLSSHIANPEGMLVWLEALCNTFSVP